MRDICDCSGLCLAMGSSGSNVVSWVVVVMAALSLFSMVCMFQIDRIVHVDLYSYGVRFSDQWTAPYMTMARLVFLFGWMNIAAAISVHMYALAFKHGEVRHLVTAVEEELSKKETSIPTSRKPVSEEPAGEKPVSETTVEENQPIQPVQEEQKSPAFFESSPEE